MSDITRFGVSLDAELLKEFDEFIKGKGYQNRSEAIRDLIRDILVEREWESEIEERDGDHMAVVSIVYDHHQSDLQNRLTETQHSHHGVVHSTLHIHLDRDNCLEILVLKGGAKDIISLGDNLISTRGVRHGKMILTTTGRGLK
jgi:CopG family nickel-responsive transcriptional regulator